jgi:hypothetical protein
MYKPNPTIRYIIVAYRYLKLYYRKNILFVKVLRLNESIIRFSKPIEKLSHENFDVKVQRQRYHPLDSIPYRRLIVMMLCPL